MYLEYLAGWSNEEIDLLIKPAKLKNGRDNRSHLTMSENGIHKAGYIDIKQPAKLKGRKLKSWKKKWVVINEMSNLAAGTSAAKVDVYADEKASTRSPSDKFTIILEKVTAVRSAKSKTHSYAFEIVESEAVLLLAGGSEMETQTWIWTLRRIFWPDETKEKKDDAFTVVLVANKHTERLALGGEYTMTITPEFISIYSSSCNSYEWSLSKLRRFYMEQEPSKGGTDVLIIESGPKSECGEAVFKFQSETVSDILASIKKNIYLAISLKKSEQTQQRLSQAERPRFGSDRTRTDSTNSSELRFRELLESPIQNKSLSEKKVSFSGSESSQSKYKDDNELPPKTRTLDKRRSDGDIFGVALLTNRSSEDTKAISSELNSQIDNVVTESETKAVDLLSEDVECEKSAADSSYNRVELKQNATNSRSPGNIISTFTVASTDYQTKILLDDRGYSHVKLKETSSNIEEDKKRSLSSISSQSSVSMRSASVGSRDSGVPFQNVEVDEKQSSKPLVLHRSTNSFDSAVSTSSTLERSSDTATVFTNTGLTVEIQEVEISGTDPLSGDIAIPEPSPSDHGIYQDVSVTDEPEETALKGSKPTLKKSNSTGNFAGQENHYEELEKFRKGKKDLSKLLGMDPYVLDPLSVPPALPDRPTSHKMKRKVFGTTDRKMFTLPFSRSKNKKTRERAASLSSDSDTESSNGAKKAENLPKVKEWPLGNMSILENNDLYQPVAIERFLKDNEGVESGPVMRERSSSLNLDMKSNLKRNSMALSTDTMLNSTTWEGRRQSKKKHSRNASLNVDILKESGSSSEDVVFDVFRKPMGTAPLTRRSVKQGLSASVAVGQEVDEFHDDEPIYAEVQPILDSIDALTAKTANVEDPFPNLETWKPQNNVSMFNVDRFEMDKECAEGNGRSMDIMNCTMSSQGSDKKGATDIFSMDDSVLQPGDQHPEEVDIFNLGFHDDSDHNSSTDILIDLSCSEPSDANSGQHTTNVIDIFALGYQTQIEPVKVNSNSTENKSLLNQTSPFLDDIFGIGVGHCEPSFNAMSVENVFDQQEQSAMNVSSNWADFSQFEAAVNSNKVDPSEDPVYMDMSTICQNSESIYVMPSQVNKSAE